MTTPYVRKILPRFIRMFKARNYTNIVVHDSDDPLTIDAVDPRDPEDEKTVKLIFLDIPKFTVRTAEECLSCSDKDHIVVVYKEGITCFAKRVLEMPNKIVVEHMPSKSLEIDITRHVLQPKFVRLSLKEGDAFIKKWGVKFPQMKINDPIAKYFNFVQNDVIEIHRKNGDIIYRIVTS